MSPSWNGPAELSNDAMLSGRASTQAGVDISRAGQQYSDTTLPGLVNAAASRGTFYGGMLPHDVSLAHKSLDNSVSDINTALAQKQADLARAGFLASTGISL
jgi:hypothetical protein